MRIDLSHTTAGHISSEPLTEQVKAQQPAAGSTVSGNEDRTTFSAHTQSLKSLVNQVMNTPEVRQEKVDSLKAALSTGKYELNPSEIASSMIDEQA